MYMLLIFASLFFTALFGRLFVFYHRRFKIRQRFFWKLFGTECNSHILCGLLSIRAEKPRRIMSQLKPHVNAVKLRKVIFNIR